MCEGSIQGHSRAPPKSRASGERALADKSQIEWTDAKWNPVTGCTQISPGCDHCYALRFAERFRGVPGHPYTQGFDLRLWPARLDLRQLHWLITGGESGPAHRLCDPQWV